MVFRLLGTFLLSWLLAQLLVAGILAALASRGLLDHVLGAVIAGTLLATPIIPATYLTLRRYRRASRQAAAARRS